MKSKWIILLTFIIIHFFVLPGCKNDKMTSSDPTLAKCWANSFEEEGEGNVLIYRPCATHTFPAARYRDTFTLNENGTVEYSVLAPDDAHFTENGTWSFDTNKKILSIFNAENEKLQEYEVVEVNEDILRLRPAN